MPHLTQRLAPDFRLLFEAAPASYLVLAPDLTIIAVSDSYLAATRTARDELCGRALFEAFPDNPDDPEATGVSNLRSSLERVLRDRRPHAMAVQKYDIARPAAEGGGFEERYWSPTNTPVLDDKGEVLHIIHHVEDVTSMVRLQRRGTELDETTQLLTTRLGTAVESIEDAFAIFDEDDRLFLCNRAYRSLMPSGTHGSFVGRHYEEIFSEWLDELDFASEHERAAMREARRSGRRNARVELDVRTRDGRSLRIIDRRTPDGGVVETIWNLTEDARLAAELREANSTAQAASAAKSEFLSSMSHELRTPLNSILGFSQLLMQDKRHPLIDRHRERLEHIVRGGQHLLTLIDDILDLARIEAGRVAMSIEPVDALATLRQIETTLAPMAHRAGLSFEHHAAAAAMPLVSADRTRFAQILMNFGSNAVKYNRPGGTIRFDVSRPDDEHVRIAVHDTGFGIPRDKQALLFQPFQRAGQEAGAIEGTGIGLVITKRLAELMGGNVGFRSIHGEGSSFWIDLPATTSSIPMRSAVGAEPASRRHLDETARAFVLYIEDNAANVSFMRDFLSDFPGIELAVAGTGEEGVEVARRRKPDVVIADINLPGMSGLDALRVLKGMSSTTNVPVLALSAAASARERKVGLDSGFEHYLTKPLNVDELETVLAELISGR